MTNTDIEKFCRDYNILNWNLNSKNEIDVDGDVDISAKKITEIPFKFGMVSGNFSCYCNRLTSLKNCPDYVGKNFIAFSNRLKDLMGCPKFIGGCADFEYNELNSLFGISENINEDLDISNNDYLKKLEHFPKSIGGNLYVPNLSSSFYKILKNIKGEIYYNGVLIKKQIVSRKYKLYSLRKFLNIR